MLTRFIKTQLVIFTIASVVGLSVMIFGYMQAPVLLGIGHITVTLELPTSGGLYPLSNVTYRGVQVGKVTEVKAVDGPHAQATLSLNSSPKISANLTARVLSVSAVGEQYVDLQPVDDSPPYLHDGSVIAMADTTIPQRVGPMLDQLSALVATIPEDEFNSLLDESFTAFQGAGYDFGSLLDSSSKITGDLTTVADQTRALIDDSGPLLDGQAESADALRAWAHGFAGITGQVARNDSQVRTLLHTAPGAADEVSLLLEQVKPTLPLLLANLTSVGQVLVTYNGSLEQLLVLLPPYIASIQAATPVNNGTGQAIGDFAITVADPPACTVGFLPPTAWRSPNDLTEVDTPDGLYCKLPQDSPIAVRGARNYPCIEHPGKRAATVEDCDSDMPFQPLATRQHALGPAPFDPNLIAQGVPPDARVNPGENLYGPIGGTALPPEQSPVEIPPADTGNTTAEPVAPETDSAATSREPPSATGGPAAAPSAFTADQPGRPAPLAVARYNPKSGAYMAPDGKLYSQTNLVSATSRPSWNDLVLPTK